MSREKTYYSADEVLNNLYASDKQLMYTDGTMYIGLYHKYSTGEIYTEAKWNSNKSKKLIIMNFNIVLKDFDKLNLINDKIIRIYPNANIVVGREHNISL